MQQQSNTGWYVLGGIALLFLVGHSIGQSGKTNTGNYQPIDSNTAPDTAGSPEIIITQAKL